MSTSRRRPQSTARTKLTSKAVSSPEARWEAIDRFLRSAPAVQVLRADLAKLLEQVREMGDFGLVEEIEEAGTKLRAEMLDQVVIWAFEEGRKAGRRDRRS